MFHVQSWVEPQPRDAKPTSQSKTHIWFGPVADSSVRFVESPYRVERLRFERHVTGFEELDGPDIGPLRVGYECPGLSKVSWMALRIDKGEIMEETKVAVLVEGTVLAERWGDPTWTRNSEVAWSAQR